MCGILGYYSIDRRGELPVKKLGEALQLLAHRGPDGSGEFIEESFYFGHRRLSIIDLSAAANQPFVSTSGQAVIVYNGEIYNYKELSVGLTLRTASDTEVLLEGYLKFGVTFFKRLRGIYAFAIYDEREKKLILYRDPSGIKPLYVLVNKKELAFASEIKSLVHLYGAKLNLNHSALRNYIHLGYVPEPHTIYAEISTLKPGNLLQLQADELKEEELFSYDFSPINQDSFEQNKLKVEALLDQASQRNLVADVKVNVALSGGIDSSLINYFFCKHIATTSITVRFSEDQFDESNIASAFARRLHTNHIIADVHEAAPLELLNKLLLHFDQPYADSSLIPFYFLTRMASSLSKVIVGGDGGDEIHNGYNSHRIFPLLAAARGSTLGAMAKLIFKAGTPFLPARYARLFLKFNSLLGTRNREQLLFNVLSWFPALPEQYPMRVFKYPINEMHSIFEQQGSNGNSNGEYAQAILFQQRMRGDYLRKADIMSMYNSVEYRIPLLDEDLVSFSLSIPYKQKSSLFESKKILREIHKKYFPIDTSGIPKRGFSLPLDSWLGTKALNSIKDGLLSNGIVDDLIEKEYVLFLFESIENNSHRKFCSRESAYQRILILHSLQLWYRESYLKLR